MNSSRLFKPLRSALSQYADQEQLERVYQAYLLGERAHAQQKRYTGEPYITHPVAVATLLANMHLDVDSIIAAILHDAIEDTQLSKADIASEFGESVAQLVDGVTKLTQIKFNSRAEAQAENFRKMVLAMVKDIRVILIKLADRLHNMRTLGAMPIEKQRRIATETLEIYAPIANRLGMHTFAIEFQELGFATLHPTRYRVLSSAVNKAKGNRKEVLKVIESAIKSTLKQHKIHVDAVIGREKQIYSIYKKMRHKQLTFAEIMDIYAVRIVVDCRDTCYRVLGAVHNLYKPVPERFKDYIAIPKANGYQSLHTTLFGPYGVPIEIQIRSNQMHFIAENGIAAHWSYKSGESLHQQMQKPMREWLHGLLEMQQSTGSSLEFIEHVKIDLYPDEIYVFTPKGDIKKLPAGSTAIDFAYAVHSDVGNHCVAVKINRRLAPLSSPLSNGMTINIITAAASRPNPAWLAFVVTGKARSNIRYFLKMQRLSESISLGKRLLDRALTTMSLRLTDLPESTQKAVAKALAYEDTPTLFENIGLGNQMPLMVARRLALFKDADAVSEPTEAAPLPIKGSQNMVLHFAACCCPIPGDPIVGVFTQGEGMHVHVEHCATMSKYRSQSPDTFTHLIWEAGAEGEYRVDMVVHAINQRGVLAMLARVISEANANIVDIGIQEEHGQLSQIDLSLTVRDRDHLASVMRRLHAVASVMRVMRKR